MVEKIFSESEEKMKKAVEIFRNELAGIRTGKASTALLETIKIPYYGSLVPLKEVANLSAPEVRLLLIQPWDRSLIGEIEKAILKSDLGLVPVNDGMVIRLSIPPLSEERRNDLVRVVKRLSEEGKVAIRNLRRDANEAIRNLERQGKISKDESIKSQEKMQELTNKYTQTVEEILERKEKEIREV